MVWFFSTVLLLCWASDNLLLSRRSHTATFFLGLRKPQKIIRLLLKSSPCYLDFRVSQFCLIYCLAYIVKESISFEQQDFSLFFLIIPSITQEICPQLQDANSREEADQTVCEMNKQYFSCIRTLYAEKKEMAET